MAFMLSPKVLALPRHAGAIYSHAAVSILFTKDCGNGFTVQGSFILFFGNLLCASPVKGTGKSDIGILPVLSHFSDVGVQLEIAGKLVEQLGPAEGITRNAITFAVPHDDEILLGRHIY